MVFTFSFFLFPNHSHYKSECVSTWALSCSLKPGPREDVLGKHLRWNISRESREWLRIRYKTLFCSLCRLTTHCIRKPHPPSPTSPTGALNGKVVILRSLSDCPRIVGISAVMFTGDDICGVGLGAWSGVRWENVSKWKCGSLCMCACECAACGGNV